MENQNENIIEADVELDGAYLICGKCYQEIQPTSSIIRCKCGQLISCEWVIDRVR